MMKNPSRKRPEVFVLIIPQVIRIYWYFSKWEVIPVCRTRTGMMRKFVFIIPQVIPIHFGDFKLEREVVVVVVVRRPRIQRESKLLKSIDILASYGIVVVMNTIIPGSVFTS